MYFRIKIFTEEGRKYADIEIPFFKDQGNIINIHARTIQPDGTIVNFSGKVFDKSIVKARGVKYQAKTFTLSEVQPGSIIEYYYTTDFSADFVFESHWVLNHELFTKSAKFSLKPYTSDYSPVSVRWTWHNLPPGTALPAEAPNHVINLEVTNVPAFQTEDYMPPENELKSRVDFIYSSEAYEKEPDRFWKKLGKKRNDQMESFHGKTQGHGRSSCGRSWPRAILRRSNCKKSMPGCSSCATLPSKPRKPNRNRSATRKRTPGNVETLWKKQYGDGFELTWLFLALARASGFEASGMWVSDRQNYFFSPNTMEDRRLDSNPLSS